MLGYSVTLIVPVYNGEAYLDRCVDSIINAATNYKVELIIIDDGSTDSSITILSKYEKEHSWIKIIQQENKGPSAARNGGLDHAQGKYIGFVDCDDCISSDYFSKIIPMLNKNPDIVSFGYDRICKNGNKKSHTAKAYHYISEQEKLISNINNNLELFWFSWSKVFKKEIIGYNRFDENLMLGEDTIFNIKSISKSSDIIRIDAPLYQYYETEGSLSSNSYKKNLLENMERHFEHRLNVHNTLSSKYHKNSWNDMYDYYIFHILPWLLSNSNFLSPEEQLRELGAIRNARFINACYKRSCNLGKRPKMITLQFLFRTNQLRILQVYLNRLVK